MTKSWPKRIDHISRDPSDNRWVNLRDCDNRVNSINQKIRCTNKSGLKGVCIHSNTNKYVAYIEKKQLYYGIDFFEACCARKSEENKCGYTSIDTGT